MFLQKYVLNGSYRIEAFGARFMGLECDSGPRLADLRKDQLFLEGLEGLLDSWHVKWPRLRSGIDSQKRADEMMASLEDSVPGNVRVRFLSICLGPPGADGLAVWHDLEPFQRAFRRLQVVGQVTWGLPLRHVRLESSKGSRHVACTETCSAILDTGTSLLAAPTEHVSGMLEALRSLKADCMEPGALPELVFELGGQTLRLPPERLGGLNFAIDLQ